MSDDRNDIEDEALEAAEEAIVDGVKKYVRPRIRSIKIPIPRAAPSSSCGPLRLPPPGPARPVGALRPQPALSGPGAVAPGISRGRGTRRASAP